ncbi:hypothetical protein [Amnibacterium sp.]
MDEPSSQDWLARLQQLVDELRAEYAGQGRAADFERIRARARSDGLWPFE